MKGHLGEVQFFVNAFVYPDLRLCCSIVLLPNSFVTGVKFISIIL